MYANNPAYKLEISNDNVSIYTAINTMDGYSTQRYLEATNQLIYSNAGATKDVLDTVMTAMLAICNDDKERDWRTKIGALAQSIQFRLKHPVDQHCAVRMGCILSFMEERVQPERISMEEEHKPPLNTISEPPEKIETIWLQKKLDLAFSDQKFYDFFFTWGIVNTPKYKEAFDILNDSDYFNKRMETIRSLIPPNINLYKS